MVDIPTHRIIDIIETREANKVEEWLKTFPSLRYVSRDGSVIYKSAITKANENIIQISDRFHLLKGLTDAAKRFITGYFEANISLILSNSHHGSTKKATYWKKTTGHIDIPTRRHISATERKSRLVEEVRNLHKKGYAPRKIAERVGVTVITAKKYLKSDFDPASSGYNTIYQFGKLKPYSGFIKGMLSKGKTFREIECLIRQRGYEGSASGIRMFATRERKLLKESGVSNGQKKIKVERKWLISLLYKPIDKVEGLTQEQLDEIIKQNPIIGKLYDLVKSFKKNLFSKKVSGLKNWIREAGLLEIDEINGFIGGITRDIEAVKNAIKYDFNNGLAEGSVNKLKVIKRIMYGRCAFYLLRNKLLHLETWRSIN